MTLDFLPSKFPAGTITDGQYLYRSLGSFWTQVFQDKNTLKGYTLGMAEELIQAYYKLIETVQQYSVKDIELYHKEKWLPLTIKKSEFNNTPFKFTPNSAIFGVQPAEDLFYPNQVFRFGFSKETGGEVFSFTPSFALAKFGVIANRVIAPSLALIPGVDVVMQEGTLYFTTDLFNNSRIPTTKVIGDFGTPATFKDTQGNIVEEELVILWIHMAEIDEQALFNNFGILLELQLVTSQDYKDILKAIFNLYVEGPTIAALTSAFASLAGSPVVIEPTEAVEDIYVDDYNQYIVTDKNVYKLALAQTISPEVLRGGILRAGDILSADVLVADSTIDPVWWQRKVQANKLAFSSHVFMANAKNQLFFENDFKLITYTGGAADKRLLFPVLGREEDVKAFQDYLNLPTHKASLLQDLNFLENVTSSLTINPVDFLFKNIFKNNTLFVKLDFYSESQLGLFVSLLPLMQAYLPPHVYLLLYIGMSKEPDELTGWNSGLAIEDFPGKFFSFDGSEYLSGARPGASLGGAVDANYYKDYINRMFCLSIGPYRNLQPLHADGSAEFNNVNNLDEVRPNSSSGVSVGSIRTDIPLSVQPPGEAVPRLPSTREIQSILLIDF